MQIPTKTALLRSALEQSWRSELSLAGAGKSSINGAKD